MKFIDEKGRLFGRVNIIDALAVVLIVLVAAFLAVRVLGRGTGSDSNSAEGAGKPALLTYQVRVTGADPLAYETVKTYVDAATGKKDQLMAGGKMVDAYVVDYTVSPHKEYLTTQDGEMVVAVSDGEEDDRLDLVFTIEAEVEDDIENVVGSQQVRVGVTHILKTTHFEFSYGSIIGAQWSELPEEGQS